MKTSNYLIALAALTSFTFVSCSDNDFLGDGPGGTFGSSSKGELSFRTSGNGKTTRAEITGEEAAKKLNNKFTVYGWKKVTNQSDATPGYQDVFQDYVVKWQGTASAGTSESNTSGWEYVGYQSEPVDATQQPYDQHIHYWDWSTSRYDFQAWSIAKGNAQILRRNVVPASPTSTTPAAQPELEFFAPTAKDLGGIYVSDKFTSVPKYEGDHLAYGDWEGAFDGLKNVNSHPDATGHRGVYSQLGTNITANQEPGIVNLLFRNLAAKVRIGIYETIPGYRVSNIVFYDKNAGNDFVYAWEAPSDGDNPYHSDMNADYPANQKYATLFADSKIFGRKGNINVRYHDNNYNDYSDDAAVTQQKDNVAYTKISTDGEAFFPFGPLTNVRGSHTSATGSDPDVLNNSTNNPDALINKTGADKYIGVTSATATMSQGNDDDYLYTYVFPMETNTKALELKVNYILTAIDGSGEQIRVSGANATVPAEFAQWRSNYAYTYLFKISDNTNGQTGETVGPAGLYPITFDACVVNAEDGMQETITTINDRSITTYQNGSKVTANNEYKVADGDIYFTVEGTNANALTALTASSNVWLYTAYAAKPEIITEEAVANYKYNNIVLTDVTDQLTIPTGSTKYGVTNSSGAQYTIDFASNTVAYFTPKENIYVVKYYTAGTPTYYTDVAEYNTAKGTNLTADEFTALSAEAKIKYPASNAVYSYKVIKMDETKAGVAYSISAPAAITNLGSSTFTIQNINTTSGNSGSGKGKVTGAAGAIRITGPSSATTDVTDRFTIVEDPEFTYTITSKGITAGTYTLNVAGATTTITVNAPVWYNGSTAIGATVQNVDAGSTIDVIIKDATSGTAMEDVVPTITGGSAGKLTASKSDYTGKITLTASNDAAGTFTVSHNGASFTINVDKYTITASRTIINVGDTEHKKATLTLTNAGASAVNNKSLTSSAATVAADATTEESDDADAEIEALKAGTTTYSYINATCDIEVVDYKLSQAMTRGGVLTVQLKQKKAGEDSYTAVSDAVTLLSAEGCTIESTSTAGIYKVKSAAAGKVVQFKYKGVIVADVTLGADPGSDPAL